MKLKIDSPVIQAGIKMTNILILNFWFVIGCLPILTIGTSIIAASSVCLKMSEDREESSITKTYWKAWKENLKHGVIYTLLCTSILWVCYLNWQIFDVLPDAPLFALIASIAGLLLLVTHTLYAFALEARYENSFLATLLNSRRIFIRFFLRTLGILGVLAVQVILFGFTSPFLSYVGLFCAPAIMIYSVCKIAMPIFRKIEADSMAHDGFAIAGNH